MILIADSGSTKTDWSVVQNRQLIRKVTTQGMNPFFQSAEEMGQEIENALIPQLANTQFKEIHFFGAGCLPEKRSLVRDVLARYFHVSKPIEVETDLLGAARALCGDNSGIVCILGTGSNSCFYNGKEIISNVSPLGFILGDEGSGAHLGKLLVGDLLKNQLGETLKEKFFKRFNLTQAQIIERIYRQPFPNRFLAGLSPFLAENMEIPEIYQLVFNAFKTFLTRNVMQYDYQNYPTHLIGSIAFYYQDILKCAAAQAGVNIGTITQSPMEGLCTYYSKKQPWNL